MLKLELQQAIFSTVNRELLGRPDIRGLLTSAEQLDSIFDIENDLREERVTAYRQAYFGVGNTRCYKVNLPNENQLFIKAEYLNSMGNSHYARYWIVHLFICEVLHLIQPGTTEIIEVSSGSSGIALAMACESLDFDVTILVPSLLPESRVRPMQRATTTIVRVPGYIDACIAKLREMLPGGRYFATNHCEEKANVIAYVFSRIANEILQEVREGIDYAFLAVGNGTTTLAISRVLKEVNKHTRICAYHPNYEANPHEIVFGLKAANFECRHIPEAMELVDDLRYTSGIDLQSVRSRYSHDTEIRNLGYSSLYGLHFAYELAQTVHSKRIVTLGYDKIDRY